MRLEVLMAPGPSALGGSAITKGVSFLVRWSLFGNRFIFTRAQQLVCSGVLVERACRRALKMRVNLRG